MDQIPPLSEIETRMIGFLRQLRAAGETEIGEANSVAWLFAEDCVFFGRALQLRLPLSKENSSRAAALARSAKASELGAEVRAAAEEGGILYCTFYVPTSLCDAGDRGIEGLKLSVPPRAVPLRIAAGGLRWIFLRLLGKSSTKYKQIMSPSQVARVLSDDRPQA